MYNVYNQADSFCVFILVSNVFKFAHPFLKFIKKKPFFTYLRDLFCNNSQEVLSLA
jgi:hypothetical protein